MPSRSQPSAQSTRGLSCEGLREWVRGAQPGARLEYARGTVLAEVCERTLRELVMKLAEAGYLSPHRSRDPESRSFVHIVVRGSRPVLKGAAL